MYVQYSSETGLHNHTSSKLPLSLNLIQPNKETQSLETSWRGGGGGEVSVTLPYFTYGTVGSILVLEVEHLMREAVNDLPEIASFSRVFWCIPAQNC